ncbi:MAG: rhomboid family intramembrane serine protease [Bacteroidetes bacterium]|nr:MAG: rhomboid family intramembrane serine protease [Bacteroidota bacterium]
MSYYRYSNSSYYRPSFFGGFSFFPPVIKALLISNVSLYLLAMFFGMFQFNGFPLEYFINYIFALYPFGKGFQVWQLVTYMFMHGGLFHLLFNMLALWMFGMELENTWGSRKFLLYYLICGLGAGVTHLIVSPLFGVSGPTVGASGAIYGVLLAYGILFPERPIFVYFLLPIRAKYFVLLYIGFELFSGITGTQDGIAHFAHLGGAAVGLIMLMIDRQGFRFGQMFSKSRLRYVQPEYYQKTPTVSGREDISDATYYDIRNDEERATQQRLDEILDKINQSGYQSLTYEEKQFLFEASKRLN